MHSGRLKNAGQARYLVKRLKRFQKELPVAEANLSELLNQLDSRDVPDKQLFVQQLRLELRDMAESKCLELRLTCCC